MDENRRLRVFLCHSSNDKPLVRILYKRLLLEQWIDPWLDEVTLKPGQDWQLEIEKAVDQTDVVIVCLSQNSITREGYIQKEISITTRFHITTRLRFLLRDFRVYTHERAIKQRGDRHESKNETHHSPRHTQAACQWTQANRSDQCPGCAYDCG